MSSRTSSRIKDRVGVGGGGGGGAKAMAPTKPLSSFTPRIKGAITGAGSRRTPVATGKENPPWNLSAGLKASAARPNAPALKPSVPAGGPGGGVRWSTSSLPRGRAPSPSCSSRLTSDQRGQRCMPRVSASDQSGRALGREMEAEAGGRMSLGGIRASERPQQGKGLGDLGSKWRDQKMGSVARVSESRRPKISGLAGLQTAKKDSKSLDASSAKVSKKAAKTIVVSKELGEKEASKMSSARVKGDNGDRTLVDSQNVTSATSKAEMTKVIMDVPLETTQNKNSLFRQPKDQDEVHKLDTHQSVGGKFKDSLSECSERLDGALCDNTIPGNDLSDKGSMALNCKVETKEKTSENIRVFEKVEEDAKGVHAVNKCPSKLKEKLALLEGKVQKIASEIKRTKEMLDNNNPNDSKLILHDIQSKISGIEKAVGQIVEGSNADTLPHEGIKAGGCLQNKIVLLGKSGDMISSTQSGKGLNCEELEARFFPHQKLLRSLSSSGNSGDNTSNFNKDAYADDGSSISIDNNTITSEFLASLNNQQSEVCKPKDVWKSGHVVAKEVGLESKSSAAQAIKVITGQSKSEIELLATEKLEEFDNNGKRVVMTNHEGNEESSGNQLSEIGRKACSGGWFVSEGEAVLLAHDDGSCSCYDIANYEFKAEYKIPADVSSNLWGDCWLIRAPGIDGCSGRYVVAASAGNTLESGFCSWDYYTRDVKAFHLEDGTDNPLSSSSSRPVLSVLNNAGLSRRSDACSTPVTERPQWWYRPCGPLLLSTASRQKMVTAYDIRDGDLVMKWEVSCPNAAMEYSSPLQWRSRGKVIIAGTEAISLWDVNSLNPQALVSVSSAGKRVHSLHVNNTDAELGGGVRQRASSSEVEGNDGVFTTQESINVFDFRLPTGVGLKISRHGAIGHSIFSRGDSIFVGSTEGRLPIKGGPRSRVQQYSLRKGKLVTTYELPEFNTHYHHSSITQVWGNSNLVMATSGMGLFVFDAVKDEGSQTFCFDRGNTVAVKETIGPDDLYCPTFDYLGSRVLVISKDRPAFWRYLF